jgi:hypothetical protein
LFLLNSSATTRGQLVADGETNVLDNVITNVSGGITIGAGRSNLVLISDPGSRWAGYGFHVCGSGNQLVISNGGRFEAGFSLGAVGSVSLGHTVVVTDPGSRVQGGFSIGQCSSSGDWQPGVHEPDCSRRTGTLLPVAGGVTRSDSRPVSRRAAEIMSGCPYSFYADGVCRQGSAGSRFFVRHYASVT